MRKFWLVLLIVPFLFMKETKAISIINSCKDASYSEIENFVENHKETLLLKENATYFSYCTASGYNENTLPENLIRAGIGCTFDEIDNYKNGKETPCKTYFEIYKNSDGSLQLYTDPNLKTSFSFPSYYQYINVVSLKDINVEKETLNINKTALMILTILLFLIVVIVIVGWL